MVQRHDENPIITPRDVTPSRSDFEVVGAFNAGVTTMGGETILLLRVAERPRERDAQFVVSPRYDVDGNMLIERIRRDDPDYDTSDSRYATDRRTGQIALTSVSHVRLARSRDGVHFEVEKQPFIQPEGRFETFGVEDARVTRIDDHYFINYSAVSEYGISTGFAKTDDFQTVKRLGIIFPPANRDVVIFPEPIGGLYWCYHRPMPDGFGGYHIWCATSPDLVRWGDHRLILQASAEGWENGRVGGGAPPLKTERGWLSIYHAADRQNRYCLGAFLTTLDDPSRVIARSQTPILAPEMPYETEGFFGNVVFTCGALLVDDRVRVYYGVSDESIALVEFSLPDLLAQLHAG